MDKNDVFRRFVTVFIDNLPQGIRKVWLYNFFSRFGKIQSVYVPNKKSKATGNQFGFLRFESPLDALRAVKEVNGLWIWGETLVANIARFGVQNKRKRMQSNNYNQNGTPEMNGQGMSSGKGRGLILSRIWRPKNVKGLSSKSFIAQNRPKNKAHVWRKKEIPMDQKKQSSSCWVKNPPPVKVKEPGNGWLYRSAIAKLSSTQSIVRIQDQLRNLSHAHVLVRHMGGDRVVLTFKDPEERDTMFNGGKMAWLKEWFVESSKWGNTKSNLCSRLVWLNCYGIPLHLWNHQTFSEIGKIWGEVIMLADDTIKNLSFAVGCQVEAFSLHKPLDDSSMQSLTKRDNGGDVRSKVPLIEEVAESASFPMEAVPSLLGPYPTMADKSSCMVKINSMQLVPYTGSKCFEQATRCSRSVEYSPPKGRKIVNSYLEALTSNVVLPKQCISPLKVNSFIPLIPNYVSHVSQNNLSIASHNKKSNPNNLNDSIQVSILHAISKKNKNLDDKPKRKQRSIEDILGLEKPVKSKKGGGRAKQKCVVFCSAMAVAAFSVSTEGL
ncbi:hypothetical protein Acr_08g0016030 [Actinidia rufa]|uniref:RRM domain-containing protein n=1 Tax=Actinidia rufa TaxID=165716 RepID=A0A7J0F5J5_9ERIC|nr:hypothetical protein Acr_08g0016030 [Actinidia rufa]